MNAQDMNVDIEANASFLSDNSEHAQNLSQREDLDINARLEKDKSVVGLISRAATLYNKLPNRRKLKSDEKTVAVQYSKLNMAQVKHLMTLIKQDKWAAVVYDG
jgi:hypothetical protein